MGDDGYMVFPRLTAVDTIGYVRFIAEWVSKEPNTTAGRLHQCLVRCPSECQLEVVDQGGTVRSATYAAQHKGDELLFESHPSQEAVLGIVQQALHCLSAAGGASAPCPPIVRRAFEHILSDEPSGSGCRIDTGGTEPSVVTKLLLVAAKSTDFHGALVLLLFHRCKVVRRLAIKLLLHLPVMSCLVGNVGSPDIIARALWLLSAQLLCSLTQLTRIPIRVVGEEMRCAVVDGVCGLFVVLGALNKELTDISKVLSQQRVLVQRKTGVFFGNISTAPHAMPILDHVFGDSVLTLGGSAVVHWLLSSFQDSRGEISKSTLAAMAMALDNSLKGETLHLGPAAHSRLRMAVATTLLHMIKTTGRAAGECGINTNVEQHDRQLRSLWRLALYITPPHSIAGASVPTEALGEAISESPPGKLAGWIATLFLGNLGKFTNFEAAVQTARTYRSGYNNEALRTMEIATYTLSSILCSLHDVVPQLVETHRYHNCLQSIQRGVADLVSAVLSRWSRPTSVALLLKHFAFTDVKAFIDAGSSPPKGCFGRIWEVYYKQLESVCGAEVGGSQQSTLPSMRSLLISMLDVMTVFAESPATRLWLLSCTQKDLRGDPCSFTLAVLKCMKNVADLLEKNVLPIVQQQGNKRMGCGNLGSDGSWASGDRWSPVLRFAGMLVLAPEGDVGRVGNAILSIYLPVLGHREALCSNMATHMLQDVIFNDKVLNEYPLLLDDERVNNAACEKGAIWINAMSACCWSEVAAWVRDACWWLCALVTEHSSLSMALYVKLSDKVIQVLPQIRMRTLSAPNVKQLALKPLPAATKRKTRKVLNCIGSSDSSDSDDDIIDTNVFNNGSESPLGPWRDVNLLCRCAQRLMMAVVSRWGCFPQQKFVNSVLHIACVLSSLPCDESFYLCLNSIFYKMLPSLRGESLNALLGSDVRWLAEMLQQVKKALNCSAVPMALCKQGFMTEERREKEACRQEASKDSLGPNYDPQNVQFRDYQRRLNQQQDDVPVTGVALGGEAAVGMKRRREEVLDPEEGEQPSAAKRILIDPSLQQQPQKQQELLTAPRVNETAQTEVKPLGPSNFQRLREYRVCGVGKAPKMGNCHDALRRVVGYTNFLQYPPPIGDIIGHGGLCLAEEMPIIPNTFDTATSKGDAAYVFSFIPHIAVELRHELYQKFEEMLDSCRPKTRVARASPFDILTSAKDVGGGIVGNNNGMRDMETGMSASAWIVENSQCVVCTGDVAMIPTDSTQIQFSVMLSSRGEGLKAQSSILSTFSEGDVGVLMFPLGPLRAALPDAFNGCDMPPVWAALGCVPQTFIVTVAQPGQNSLVLTVFTQPKSRQASCEHVNGRKMPSIVFAHALRAFINRKSRFYIRRLLQLGHPLAVVSALFGVVRKPIAATLMNPGLAAAVARDHARLLNEELFNTQHRWGAFLNEILLREYLDEHQARAVAIALVALVERKEREALGSRGREAPPPDITIIEGPPGTGKTQTIAVLTVNLLQQLPEGKQILLCASSNRAVDEVLLRLRKLLAGVPSLNQRRLLRVGIRESVDAEVLSMNPAVFFDDVVATSGGNTCGQQTFHTEIATGSGPYNRRSACSGWDSSGSTLGSKIKRKEQVMHSASVVCTTIGSIPQIQRFVSEYDVVVVDEASQCTEPETLLAVVLAKKRLVLVGDSRQLQPTVLCADSATHGLRRSLLQRLLNEGYPPLTLLTQFRMHSRICAFPNEYFYGGNLSTHVSVDKRAVPTSPVFNEIMRKKLQNLPRLIFVDVHEGCMETNARGALVGKSVVNMIEAKVVAGHMRRFREFLKLSITEFAKYACIITFYRAQRDAILAQLTADERRSGIQVATTDSFQGKEKDFVFVSCVRAPKRKTRAGSSCTKCATTLGFLQDWHRINVALTRAKEFCIVFGHRQTFVNAVATSKEGAFSEATDDEDELFEGLTSVAVTQRSELIDEDTVAVEKQAKTKPLQRPDSDPFVFKSMLQYARIHPTKAVCLSNTDDLDVLKLLLSKSCN